MHQHATVHVVDDDEPYRTAVSRLLRTQGYQIMAYASAEDFLKTKPERPGCVLLDVRMSGLSGLQLQERFVAIDTSLPIIFVTGHGDIPMSVRAIKAGAEDFLVKPVPLPELKAAIERALQRQEKTLAALEHLKKIRARRARLTPREAEVFTRVVAGKLNREIAEELGTAERTVKAHRHQVMEKMEASSLAELVSMARLMEESAGRRR